MFSSPRVSRSATTVRSLSERSYIMNLQLYYNFCFKSEWGWNEENKRKELNEEAAWFLIAREKETEVPVAFSHFRSRIV